MAQITVAVPVYNKIQFLDECVDSVINQSSKAAELLLIDDGSTDGSAELIDKYAKSHDFIKAVHYQNAGLLQTRRRALQHIKSGYVFFLDADDYLRNDAIQVLLTAIDKSDNADILAFGFKRTTRNNTHTKAKGNRELSLEKWSIEEARRWLLRGNSNNLCGKLIKRSCFDDHMTYADYGRLMHGEDLLQSLEVFDKAASFALVKDAIYFYRQSSSNSTAQYTSSQLQDLKAVVHELLNYGKRWSGNTNDAVVGGLIQYCALYCLLESSQSASDLQADKNEIKEKIAELHAMQPHAPHELKLHYRALIQALLNGSTPRAHFIAKAIQTAKSARTILK